MRFIRFFPLIAGGILLCAASARANVYATDIKVNGHLQSVTNSASSPVTISYRLNQAATLGVTVDISQGATNVATISGGTNSGLNTVVWDGTNNSGIAVAEGAYSLSITAAASGFSDWQQISVDTNSGAPAFYPLGIAVDNNAGSPYYGRVVMSCALSGSTPTNNVPVAAERVGIYKMNADGTKADEGWYGNANYLDDDFGDAPSAGQMPDAGGLNPMKLRVGDDDRIYWVDDSYVGAIVSCDMTASTNQLVINKEGYFENPDLPDLVTGVQEFDVTGTTTTNAAIWLCDNDNPNWGIWMYHLTNGVANTDDKFGVQVVETGADLNLASSGGCTVDDKLDIFVGEGQFNEDAVYNAMVFTNWNNGALPPPDTDGSTATSFVMGGTPGEVAWGFGCGVDTVCSNDPAFEAVMDVVINSRTNPTLVACPMGIGADNGNGGGIRVLNAPKGLLIPALTNLDWGQAYTCAAWDSVGNLYGASTTRNLWRVWTPPGPNTNTTVWPPSVVLTAGVATPINITSIKVNGASVTINFTGPASAAAASFSLQSTAALNVAFSTVSGLTATGSGGVFTFSTTTSGAVRFYRISQ